LINLAAVSIIVPAQKITISSFSNFTKQHPVFDVRSPGEYTQAHLPGAVSLPLFSDEERKIVGTAYKQQSREAAIKTGLDFFGPKMRAIVETVEKTIKQSADPSNKTIMVHCWRGGMRSAAIAWLLDLYGFKVQVLAGGYKAYRQWVRAQFEKPYPFHIIGGYTGSNKTGLLPELERAGKTIIDLEALANHKGSAFGAVGLQPRQEMFENLLAEALAVSMEKESGQTTPVIYMEDESQRIGNLQIPMPLWYGIRKCPILFLEVPFEERLSFITKEYSSTEKEKLVNNTIRIQKRLGGLDTKSAINFLLEDDYAGCFSILLRYYDKYYTKALESRENLSVLLNKIPCSNVDTTTNLQKLLACKPIHV